MGFSDKNPAHRFQTLHSEPVAGFSKKAAGRNEKDVKRKGPGTNKRIGPYRHQAMKHQGSCPLLHKYMRIIANPKFPFKIKLTNSFRNSFIHKVLAEAFSQSLLQAKILFGPPKLNLFRSTFRLAESSIPERNNHPFERKISKTVSAPV